MKKQKYIQLKRQYEIQKLRKAIGEVQNAKIEAKSEEIPKQDTPSFIGEKFEKMQTQGNIKPSYTVDGDLNQIPNLIKYIYNKNNTKLEEISSKPTRPSSIMKALSEYQKLNESDDEGVSHIDI